ncbi:uncharacterized protein LOC143986781 [Lithobates pipiens]
MDTTIGLRNVFILAALFLMMANIWNVPIALCIKRGITPGTQESPRNGEELHEINHENQSNGIARTYHQTNSNEQEPLRNGEELYEVIHENQSNGIARTYQTNSNEQEPLRNGEELHEIIHENQSNGISRPYHQTNSNEQAEPLRNGVELHEIIHENQSNGIARTYHQTNSNEQAWVEWFRKNWKWIAFGTFCTVSIVSVLIGIGISIGMNLHQNNATVCPNGKAFEKGSDGWVFYNGHQYYFSEELRNWTYSVKYCEEHEAVLAVLEDNDIKENVNRFKKHTDEQWCGGYNENGEQKWLNKALGENERLKNISGPNCLTWNPGESYLSDCAEKKTFICIK